MNQVKFGSNVIKYVIFKTNRIKTSEIIVDKDNVILRCPSSKTNEELEQIMTQKARWIFEKQQQFKKEKSVIIKPTYSNNTTVPYLGKNYILEVKTNQKKNSVKFTNDVLTVNLEGKRPIKKEVQKVYEKWLTLKGAKYLEARTEKLGTKIDLKPLKIIVKNLKGKWGNALKGTITFNINLMKCDKDTIDYIIIHELCHLKIQDHSHRYWKLVRNYYPKYEEKVEELKILSRIII